MSGRVKGNDCLFLGLLTYLLRWVWQKHLLLANSYTLHITSKDWGMQCLFYWPAKDQGIGILA